MTHLRLLIFLLVLTAAAADDVWQSKKIADWTDDDAKQVLADSPWVKNFTPAVAPAPSSQGGGMGRPGGIGIGGVGIGIPGMGRRGMGMPGGGYPSGRSGPNDVYSGDPPRLTLRWETALPVRSAELKTHDNDAPAVDDEHYALAVYGVPDRVLSGNADSIAAELKRNASIKRDGKKDIKPSAVQVLDRPDGRIVVYLFPLKAEISRQDHRIEFDAKVGRLELTQSFFTEDMIFQGKLEL